MAYKLGEQSLAIAGNPARLHEREYIEIINVVYRDENQPCHRKHVHRHTDRPPPPLPRRLRTVHVKHSFKPPGSANQRQNNTVNQTQLNGNDVYANGVYANVYANQRSTGSSKDQRTNKQERYDNDSLCKDTELNRFDVQRDGMEYDPEVYPDIRYDGNVNDQSKYANEGMRLQSSNLGSNNDTRKCVKSQRKYPAPKLSQHFGQLNKMNPNQDNTRMNANDITVLKQNNQILPPIASRLQPSSGNRINNNKMGKKAKTTKLPLIPMRGEENGNYSKSNRSKNRDGANKQESIKWGQNKDEEHLTNQRASKNCGCHVVYVKKAMDWQNLLSEYREELMKLRVALKEKESRKYGAYMQAEKEKSDVSSMHDVIKTHKRHTAQLTRMRLEERMTHEQKLFERLSRRYWKQPLIRKAKHQIKTRSSERCTHSTEYNYVTTQSARKTKDQTFANKFDMQRFADKYDMQSLSDDDKEAKSECRSNREARNGNVRPHEYRPNQPNDQTASLSQRYKASESYSNRKNEKESQINTPTFHSESSTDSDYETSENTGSKGTSILKISKRESRCTKTKTSYERTMFRDTSFDSFLSTNEDDFNAKKREETRKAHMKRNKYSPTQRKFSTSSVNEAGFGDFEDTTKGKIQEKSFVDHSRKNKYSVIQRKVSSSTENEVDSGDEAEMNRAAMERNYRIASSRASNRMLRRNQETASRLNARGPSSRLESHSVWENPKQWDPSTRVHKGILATRAMNSEKGFVTMLNHALH